MNWTTIILVSMIVLGLLVFIIIRNQRDGKKFEEQVKQDYPRPRESEGDIEIDQKMQ